MTRIALIPARGGSQRIARKNVRPFRGTPIIARVIETVTASGLVDDIVVSTDDAEIAEIARGAGARAPFVRPADLADAVTGVRPVIRHALAELAVPDAAETLVVYPTSVLVTTDDLVDSHALLTPDVDFVMAVAEFPAPIARALTVTADAAVAPVDAGQQGARSQDLPRAFHDVGLLYWGTAAAWNGPQPVVEARTRAHVVPAWRAVDIDTEADWERAEIVHGVLHGG